MSTVKLPGGDGASKNRGPLEIHIEEFVIHGFEHFDWAELGTEVRKALVQLLEERGVPAVLRHDTHIDILNGGTFTVDQDANPRGIGGHIVQAIYRSFGS